MTASICVENVSKKFRINHMVDTEASIWDKIKRKAAAPIQSVLQGAALGSVEDFWAVRDLSFSMEQGEVLGIVGHNGAGKSTLLKVLTRIMEPTLGQITYRGRVACLLEVGTGFHQELTGRDNIYLNASVLGMRRREVNARFDDIVEFAGVEKFLDTPVKRYSSGMKVRLAFSVAAHLQPEILLVDEVLAVGDSEFQRKCLGKMEEVARQGRTIIFVSHNMAAVRTLCPRVIHMDHGRIIKDGDSAEIIHDYLESTFGVKAAPEMDLTEWPRMGSAEVRLVHARLLDEKDNCVGHFNRLDPLTLEFTIEGQIDSPIALSATCVTSDEPVNVLLMSHHDTPGFSPGGINGRKTIRAAIDSLPLQAGEYEWHLTIHSETPRLAIDHVERVLPFIVHDDAMNSPRPFHSINQQGLCTQLAHWTVANNS